MDVWVQNYDPFGNLELSALIASVPLFIMFYLLAVRRMPAALVGPIALALMVVVAVAEFGMPGGKVVASIELGFLQAIFPLLVLVGALAFQNVLVATGRFDLLRKSLVGITPDGRLQVLFIGFCYGALLEAIAGGGTPVLITVSILTGLGLGSFQAAKLCLLSNSTPVAFGAVGLPFVYMALVTGLPLQDLSSMVGRQIPFTAMLIPGLLMFLLDGWRGVRQTWPAIVIVSVVFVSVQIAASNLLGPYLPDFLASLGAMGAFVLLVRIWQPRDLDTSSAQKSDGIRLESDVSLKMNSWLVFQAWLPMIILVLVIGFWSSSVGTKLLTQLDFQMPWSGLDKTITRVPPIVRMPSPYGAVLNINWLSGAGTGILIATLLTAVVTAGRSTIPVFAKAIVRSGVQLRFAIVVSLSITTMSFVMNYAGITSSLGLVVAQTGPALPFFAAFIGWLGVFTTGSDTSSSILFGNLQASAATAVGLNPVLLASTNISGGAAAKMISPLELAVATSAGGLAGSEGNLMRSLLPWSLALTALIGLIALTQAHLIPGLIP
jgi:lactate permease